MDDVQKLLDSHPEITQKHIKELADKIDNDILNNLINNPPIPEEYEKLKFYNWNGIFYYNNKPCTKVDKIEEGNIIDEIHDYPVGNYYVHDTGYITGKTICGNVNLKI